MRVRDGNNVLILDGQQSGGGRVSAEVHGHDGEQFGNSEVRLCAGRVAEVEEVAMNGMLHTQQIEDDGECLDGSRAMRKKMESTVTATYDIESMLSELLTAEAIKRFDDLQTRLLFGDGKGGVL